MKFFSIKKLIITFSISLFLWILISYIGANLATHSQRKQIPDIQEIGEFSIKNVDFQTRDKIKISAWLIDLRNQNSHKDTIVILLAGIWSNRTALSQNAQFYLKKGYSVLLPDLRASGKSEGEYISFGWHERQDLFAAYDFLQNQGFRHLAVHGQSLGAATIAYSFQNKTDYAFVVLESCYDNIHNAFANRVFVFSLDNWFCSLMKYWIESKIQVKAEQLRPEDYISLYKGKILLLAGDNEYKVKETQKLFDLAQAKVKQLHFFKKGKHESFIRKFPLEYEIILNQFLIK